MTFQGPRLDTCLEIIVPLLGFLYFELSGRKKRGSTNSPASAQHAVRVAVVGTAVEQITDSAKETSLRNEPFRHPTPNGLASAAGWLAR